ncbi:MAG: hypothetical protein J6X66_12190, partial [Lachnospiraceae bacterium]|nr:hypothetical protein [Lachnospiraceae bacterium]
GSGLASYSDGVLTVSYPDKDLKAKTYTVTLANNDVKTNVKIKVSNKDLAKSISLKVQSRYDVVTGQKMVIVPTLKDIDGEITGVEAVDKDYSAVVNEAGNIIVDYSGKALDARHLKMGNLSYKLMISGIDEKVTVTIKNVKAKRSDVTVNAAGVSLKENKAGTANIICSYKDASGAKHLISPLTAEIKEMKHVQASKSDDPTVINIFDLTKKKGSVTLKLTFPGNVTKKVTVKVTR